MKDWRANQYYPSTKPCCVCGSAIMTGQEPRFGYVVCEKHSHLSPVEINKQRTDGK